MSRDLERARAMADDVAGNIQSAFSFDVFRPHTPQELCNQIGLNWVAALELHQKGYLSFDPRTASSLTRTQEAELRFLGGLVVAGCCGSVMATLLAGLKKPYAYHLDRMYYDWSHRQWKLIEDTSQLEAHFEEWLSELVAWGDLSVLQRLQKLIEESVAAVDARHRVYETRESGRFVMRGTGEGR